MVSHFVYLLSRHFIACNAISVKASLATTSHICSNLTFYLYFAANIQSNSVLSKQSGSFFQSFKTYTYNENDEVAEKNSKMFVFRLKKCTFASESRLKKF